jgi:hypothetical protein
MLRSAARPFRRKSNGPIHLTAPCDLEMSEPTTVCPCRIFRPQGDRRKPQNIPRIAACAS